jgi:hypothetical protein
MFHIHRLASQNAWKKMLRAGIPSGFVVTPKYIVTSSTDTGGESASAREKKSQ